MPSSLDRKLALTFFPNIYGKTKTQEDLSLNELADRIESTQAKTKEGLPWVKGGTFGNLKTEKDSLRNNENFKSFDAIEIDYDAGLITPQVARSRFEEADVAAVIYTSASNSPDHSKFRVLLPCSETLKPAARENLVMRANGLLDGGIDGVSFTLSQSFYFGKVEGKDQHFKLYRIEGRYIDLAEDLEAGKRGKRQREKADNDNASDQIDDSGSGEAWRKCKDLVREGGTINDFEEWAAENPWKDYLAGEERVHGTSNPNPAIDRTWGRAVTSVAREHGSVAGAGDFEDLGDENDKPIKKESKPLILQPVREETLEMVPPLMMLYQNHYARGMLSGLFAPGGVGKSALSINEGIAMASGIDFLGPRVDSAFSDLDEEGEDVPEQMFKTFDPLRVGIFNFEDDTDTMRRRIAAARQHHNISYNQVKGNLFFSGSEQQAVFSRAENGKVVFNERTWSELERLVETLKLDVLNLDPFVSTHLGDENSNGEMAEVWGHFREFLTKMNIGGQLAHHTRKGTPGIDHTVDSARGASSMIGIVRFARVINRMKDEDAQKFGVTNPWSLIRLDDGKANHTPHAEKAEWRRLCGVESDMHEISTVAIERWEAPEVMEGEEPTSAAERDRKSKSEVQQFADLVMQRIHVFCDENPSWDGSRREVLNRKQFSRICDQVPECDHGMRFEVKTLLVKTMRLMSDQGQFIVLEKRPEKDHGI